MTIALVSLLSLSGILCVLLAVRVRRYARQLIRAEELRTSLEHKGEERERLLRTLLDASPVAMLFFSDAGRIAYANQAARDLFFEGKAAEGQNFLRLVDEGPEAFRAALLGDTDEIVGFNVEGGHETYHFARRTFEYAGDLHTLLVVRPMTREVARHEIEVLKKVVRLISHEVNNSLAPISSLTHSARQIMKSGERLERLDRVFETIDERAKHLAGFIGGYAALAKLPRPKPTEVNVSELLSRLSTLYPEAQIPKQSDARGFFDAAQLEQALINLLKNACEAGGSRAEVALEVLSGEEGALEIHVLDRGKGFAPDVLQSALLPFYTTKPGGSGVGLALVREVVDAHGGQLSLGVREGGGAAVTIRLPQRRAPKVLHSRTRLTLTRP